MTWDDLSSDEQQTLEQLFTNDSFPVARETTNRLLYQGLAIQRLGRIEINLAGEGVRRAALPIGMGLIAEV